MRSAPQADIEQAVMSRIGITQTDIARREMFVCLGSDDVERHVMMRDVIARHVDALTDELFAHLAGVSASGSGRTRLSERSRMSSRRWASC